MKNILVTGANGQLGTEIRNRSPLHPELNFRFTDLDDLNIGKKSNIIDYCNHFTPDLIINCAAYNLVDKAEDDPAPAILVNTEAVANLADVAGIFNAGLIHISTDYVFDGKAFRPYSETDQPNPLSAYARSKYGGETELINRNGKFVIIRTSWLYSSHGQNFVKTILKYGKERESLRVVDDQTGTPTFAGDLAEVVLQMIPEFDKISQTEIFHFSNEGVASWYDFAKAILRMAGIGCKVFPVSTEDYPLPAKRPFYSVMNKSKIKQFLGMEIPYWLDSLEKSLHSINK
ncbi:MAG: dTDP-4-dehydrorhamnose reductase [Bacteroidetes bacterium]|nr:dTDP-4-dehydrorhamnose reductase [Bacteroidota bacterium]